METKLCFVPSVSFRPNWIKGKYFKNTSTNTVLQIAPKAKSIGTHLRILLKYINIFIKVMNQICYITAHIQECMLHESKIPVEYNKIKICE